MIIYKATNKINGKVYIGLTSQEFAERQRKHKLKSVNAQTVFAKAIRKYGWDSFEWEIIDSANTIEELCEKEIYWISFFNSYVLSENSNGYNMTTGGEGSFGYKHSEESRDKMKSVHADFSGENHPQWGMKHTEESKERMRKSFRDRYKKENHPNFGKKLDESHRKNISKAKKEQALHKGEKNGRAKLTGDKVWKIHELYHTGNYTQKSLAKEFNVSKSMIGNILRGEAWGDIKEEFERGNK